MSDLKKTKVKKKAAVAEFEKGVLCLQEKDFIQAALHFKTVQRKFREIVEVVRAAGEYLKLTEPQEQPTLELVTSDDYYHYGVYLLRANDPDGAYAAFQTALEMNPEDTDAMYNVACFKAAEGDYDLAYSMIRTVVELRPETVDQILDDEDLEDALPKEFIDEIRPTSSAAKRKMLAEAEEEAARRELTESEEVETEGEEDFDDLDEEDDDLDLEE